MTQPRILPRFDFRVDLAVDSVTGKVRETNEDALLVAPDISLFAIADGMGGLDSGEQASRDALEVVRVQLSAKNAARTLDLFARSPTLQLRREVFALLRAACLAAHEQLLAIQERDDKRMGTTLDICLCVRDKAFVAHVGDGRVFLARSSATLQITEDHLVRGPLSVRKPTAGPVPPRPLASGIGLPSPLRVDVFVLDLQKGDTLLLCTDGAYGPLESESFITGHNKGTATALCHAIIQNSLKKGGRDNASVIALRIDGRLIERPDHRTTDDMPTLEQNPLLTGLPASSILAALAAGIEVELAEDESVPPFDASDHCAYLLLEGLVQNEKGTQLGPPALLFPGSLLGVPPRRETLTVSERIRALRIRRDDFCEICDKDPELGMALVRRLATHLARLQTT